MSFWEFTAYLDSLASELRVGFWRGTYIFIIKEPISLPVTPATLL